MTNQPNNKPAPSDKNEQPSTTPEVAKDGKDGKPSDDDAKKNADPKVTGFAAIKATEEAMKNKS